MAKCGCNKQVVQATQTGTKLPACTRIFVLSGASRRGKSTTLNKLAAYIASQVGWAVLNGPKSPHVGHNDYKYVIVNNQKNITVGISTAGDGAKQIKDGFLHFRTNGCNVCFIASKTNGDSIRHLEQECFNDSIVPQYQFLHGEYTSRNQNKVQADIVDQLFKMI